MYFTSTGDMGIPLALFAFGEPAPPAAILPFIVEMPAMMSYLLTERHGQEPEKVVTLVLLGNLGSLIAVPAVLYFTLP